MIWPAITNNPLRFPSAVSNTVPQKSYRMIPLHYVKHQASRPLLNCLPTPLIPIIPLIFSAYFLFPSKFSLAHLEANKAFRDLFAPVLPVSFCYLIYIPLWTSNNLFFSKSHFGLGSIRSDNSSRAFSIVLATKGTRIVISVLLPTKYGRGCRGYCLQVDWKSIVQAYTKEEVYFGVFIDVSQFYLSFLSLSFILVASPPLGKQLLPWNGDVPSITAVWLCAATTQASKHRTDFWFFLDSQLRLSSSYAKCL